MSHLQKTVLVASAFALLATGCATSMSSSECASADWAVLGYEDGSTGFTEKFAEKRFATCSGYGHPPDRRTYEYSRYNGLDAYCTRNNLYELGLIREEFPEACEPLATPTLRAGYKTGREHSNHLFGVKRKMDEIADAEQDVRNLTVLDVFARGEGGDEISESLEELEEDIIPGLQEQLGERIAGFDAFNPEEIFEEQLAIEQRRGGKVTIGDVPTPDEDTPLQN